MWKVSLFIFMHAGTLISYTYTKDSGYTYILQDKTLFCAFEAGDIVCWLVNQPIAKLDLFKSPDCRWICKTHAEYCCRSSATVRRLVQSPTLQSTIFCGVHSDLRGIGIRVSPACLYAVKVMTSVGYEIMLTSGYWFQTLDVNKPWLSDYPEAIRRGEISFKSNQVIERNLVVVVLRSPIHANEPSEYNGMLYRTSNRILNNGIKVIILICMDGTSQYHHHQKFWGCQWAE